MQKHNSSKYEMMRGETLFFNNISLQKGRYSCQYISHPCIAVFVKNVSNAKNPPDGTLKPRYWKMQPSKRTIEAAWQARNSICNTIADCALFCQWLLGQSLIGRKWLRETLRERNGIRQQLC